MVISCEKTNDKIFVLVILAFVGIGHYRGHCATCRYFHFIFHVQLNISLHNINNKIDNQFLCPPRSKIGGHIVFVLSVILSFCPTLWIFILANNFWTVIAKASIFHMSIPCDKTFPWVPLFFTLWPWPSSLAHFLKTLTLPITFIQWVLERWYFTWIFPVIRPFGGYHYFLPCDLDLGDWRIFWKL